MFHKTHKLYILVFTAVLLALIPPLWYFGALPNVAELKTSNPSTTAIRTFREEQAQEKGKKPHSVMMWRDLDQISPHLQNAVVLAEDDTFFQHHGFDIEQLKRAIRTNWQRKRFAFGASTITQQLARTLYLSSDKNLFRKAKEALVTRQLEQTLPKKRILELYLNSVEWGPNVYGAEAAAQFWFQKTAADLTINEAIALAVILPSPRRWSPLRQTWFMGQRRAALYDRMVRAKMIPPPMPLEPDFQRYMDRYMDIFPASVDAPVEMPEEESPRPGGPREIQPLQLR